MAYFDQGLFNAMLAQKYQILQQQADADTIRANAGLLSARAGANLDTVRAGLLPAESRASIAEQEARARNIDETSKYVGPLAQSQIGLQRSQARENIANVGFIGSQTQGNNILNREGGIDAYLRLLRQQAGLPAGGL